MSVHTYTRYVIVNVAQDMDGCFRTHVLWGHLQGVYMYITVYIILSQKYMITTLQDVTLYIYCMRIWLAIYIVQVHVQDKYIPRLLLYLEEI